MNSMEERNNLLTMESAYLKACLCLPVWLSDSSWTEILKITNLQFWPLEETLIYDTYKISVINTSV